MRPRWESNSYEAGKLMDRAKSVEDRLEKAQPGFTEEKITDVNPHMVTESGGQTKTGHYHTNGKTIETDDVKNTGARDEKVSVDKLSGKMNPHEGGGVDREVNSGGSTKEPVSLEKANPLAERREAAEGGHAPQLCGRCGGTTREGCRLHQGMDLNACPEYRPLE